MKPLETLQQENENLKDLLGQVYEMSCLDDTIDEYRSGEDDELLLCNLSLKSQIVEALDKRLLAKKLKRDALKTEDLSPRYKGFKYTNDKDPIVLADHYNKEKNK